MSECVSGIISDEELAALPKEVDQRIIWRGHPVFKQFAAEHDGPFTVPEFRQWCRVHGQHEPFPQYMDGEWFRDRTDWVADLLA